MFQLKYNLSYRNFFIYFFFLYFVYALLPFILSFNNLFDFILVRSFFSLADIEMKNYIQNILFKYNHFYLFIFNSCLFIIFFYLLKIFILTKSTQKNYPDKLFLFFSNIILIICLLFLLNDLIDFYFHYTEVLNESSYSSPFLDRSAFYVFFEERKQTHFIVGSIFAIFSMKNKSYFFSTLFILLLATIEILSLSRFYLFLISISFLIFSNKKFFPYILSFVIIVICYRLFIFNLDLHNFLSSLFFEPVSLVANEIIKILNGISILNKSNLFEQFIIDNLFVNFIFFDYSNSFYIFEAKTYQHFRNYAQYGLLDFIAYPVQIFFLILLILILRNINQKFYNLRELYLITCIFIVLMSVRGSAIYGLSFFLKMQFIFIFITIICFCIKKCKFFKTLSH